MPYRYRHFFILLPLFSLVLSGCGESDRPDLALASGIVKLDGEPVEGASVTYIPVKGGRPGSGTTDVTGRYTIKTYHDAPGAIVGEHKVAVIKISGPGAYVLAGDAPASSSSSGENDGSDSLSEIEIVVEGGADETKEPEIVYDVPQNYMNPKDSGLQITVPSGGSDALDLELSR